MIARIITGLSAGAAYALVAVGVVLIYKCTRVLSLAQGEIGAFGFFIGLRWAARGIPGLGWHPARFVTLCIAVLIGALLGAVIERVVMRPLVGRPPLDALIATLGIALFLALLEKELFGTATQFAPSPVGEWKVTVLGATLVAPRIIALGSAAAIALAIYLFFSRTRFGLAVRATTSDPTVAKLMGVRVNRVYRFSWVAAGALAGLAAALLGPAFGGLTPFAMTKFSLRALAGAVIGGLDSIWGAIIGSLFVGVLESVVGGQFASSGSAEFAVLILVIGTLVTRPRGLLGTEGAA
ncbi:MAG TPA: branched-chain amino acid ABC transporter permease [Acidimicrobiia bacterium]